MSRKLAVDLLFGLQILLFGPVGHADTTYTGKVVSITDGDTLRILYRDGQRNIRLAEIDTPERKRPRGTRVLRLSVGPQTPALARFSPQVHQKS